MHQHAQYEEIPEGPAPFMARAMAPPSWAVRLSSLYCSISVMAPGAATCPGAMLTAWGVLGRFMAVSKRDLLTCKHRDSAIVHGIVGSGTVRTSQILRPSVSKLLLTQKQL